jgi:hypothetical protein
MPQTCFGGRDRSRLSVESKYRLGDVNAAVAVVRLVHRLPSFRADGSGFFSKAAKEPDEPVTVLARA